MKKFTLFFTMFLFGASLFAQPWDVMLTITDPGNGYTNLKIKSAVDGWVENAMASDANPNPTTWTYTYSVSGAGSYEWGALADQIDWLLDEPFGTHSGNLVFDVDDSGTVTGETSFTLNTPTQDFTFRLDMNALISDGSYNVGDAVEVRGNFNNWSSNPDFQLSDDNSDGIYTLTTGVIFVENRNLEFKFVHMTGGDVWENTFSTTSGNREYTTWDGTNEYCTSFNTEGTDCSAVAVETIDTDFSVFPNPSTGLFQMSKTAVYEVTDLTGKHIAKGEGNLINLTNNAAGIYLLKTTVDNQISVQKIIVK